MAAKKEAKPDLQARIEELEKSTHEPYDFSKDYNELAGLVESIEARLQKIEETASVKNYIDG